MSGFVQYLKRYLGDLHNRKALVDTFVDVAGDSMLGFFQLEALATDPTPGKVGRIWLNSTTDSIKYDDGTAVKDLLTFVAPHTHTSDEVTNLSGVAGPTVTSALDTLAGLVPPAAPVSSVFGRTGAVASVLGDYAASLVSNDSTVAGATVKAALDSLAGSSGTPGGVDTNVQFNSAGSFAGDSGLTYAGSGGRFSIVNDGLNTEIVIRSFNSISPGAAVRFRGDRSRGSLAAPLDLLSGDAILFIDGAPYSSAGGGFVTGAAIIAEQDGPSALVPPTRWRFTTGNGATTLEALRINSSQQILASTLGSAALPAIANLSFPTTGLYWSAGPEILMSIAGLSVARFYANGISIGTASPFIGFSPDSVLELNGLSGTRIVSFPTGGGSCLYQTFVSNGTPTARTNVIGGQTLMTFESLGWFGGSFRTAVDVRIKVGTGAVSATSMPGRWQVLTSPDGSISPSLMIDVDGSKIGLHGSTPVAQNTGWSVTSLTPLKTYDQATASLVVVKKVLGTLIEGVLKLRGDIAA